MPDDVRQVTRCAVSRPELPEPAGMTAVVARANTSGPDADSGGRDGRLRDGPTSKRSLSVRPVGWASVGTGAWISVRNVTESQDRFAGPAYGARAWTQRTGCRRARITGRVGATLKLAGLLLQRPNSVHPNPHKQRVLDSIEAKQRYPACLFSSCSTARRIQLDTDLSSASARRRTSSKVAGGNRTGTGSVILERRRGRPAGPGFLGERRTRIPRQGSSSLWSSVLPVPVGQAGRCLVTADRTASARISRVRWGQRNHQDSLADVGDHQPVRRRSGRVEQGI